MPMAMTFAVFVWQVGFGLAHWEVDGTRWMTPQDTWAD